MTRLERIATQFEYTWSGPLARPEDMAKYQSMVPDAPERIFRMAESRTVDHSARLDRVVDAEIDQAKSDRSSATVFLLIFTIASIVFFSLGNPLAGGVMLSIPVLAVIKVMWSSPIGKSGPTSRTDEAD